MKYNFQEQLNEPRQKEANKHCYNYWINEGYDVEDVSENKDYFEKGIDLIKILDKEKWNIDVKCDFQTEKTGNIVFELIEICPENGEIKRGWGYNQNLNEINYFVWDNKEFIIMEFGKLRELAFSKERKAFSSLHHIPIKYFTLGILIPLEEIKQNFKVIKI